MKKVISTEKVPIKLWLEDIEDGALEQAKNLANLPFIFKHLALMPDCLTDNTEILTSTGFKFITKLTYDDLIANVSINETDENIYFEKPKNIIIRRLKKNEFIYSFNIPALDKSIRVTNKHRMPYRDELGMIADNIPHITELKDYIWGGYGLSKIKEYDISDELLCLISWIVGDGNIKLANLRKDGEYSSTTIRFGFTKQRKINRVLQLLNALNIKYSNHTTPKQTTISICTEYSKYIVNTFIGRNKQYPIDFISKLSKRQANLFLTEAIKSDGDWTNFLQFNTTRYNTKRQTDADFLSALIAINYGVAKDNIRESEGFGSVINMHYIQSLHNNNFYESNSGYHKSKIVKNKIEYSGKVVCVECSSSYFIARQDGMTFISGNCHLGYGVPIGAVLALSNVVMPNATGVDIGCGLSAIKTSLREISQEQLKKIMSLTRVKIPLGFNHQKVKQAEWLSTEMKSKLWGWSIIEKEYQSSLTQLGTLGGGNHFIEFQKGDDGYIWVMIHSGSRNLGKQVADHYNKIASELNEMWFSKVEKSKDLAFLPMNTEEARRYMIEMECCVDFAFANRKLMIDNIFECISTVIPDVSFFPVGGQKIINIAHNYAKLEHHFGHNVVVHRKGATSAKKGEVGIIPGSQGTKSYIVEGLGNPESYESCSHGAGRRIGRKAAQRELDLKTEIEILNKQGIIHGIRNISDLDEASGAYKDIQTVMENQTDLVKILVELSPLAVIKG